MTNAASNRTNHTNMKHDTGATPNMDMKKQKINKKPDWAPKCVHS